MEKCTLRYLVLTARNSAYRVEERIKKGELTDEELAIFQDVYAALIDNVEPTLDEPISSLASLDVGVRLFRRFPGIDRSTALGDVAFAIPIKDARFMGKLREAQRSGLLEAAYTLRRQQLGSDAAKGERLRRLLDNALYRFRRNEDLLDILRKPKVLEVERELSRGRPSIKSRG